MAKAKADTSSDLGPVMMDKAEKNKKKKSKHIDATGQAPPKKKAEKEKNPRVEHYKDMAKDVGGVVINILAGIKRGSEKAGGLSKPWPIKKSKED